MATSIAVSKNCKTCGREFWMRDLWKFYFPPNQCFNCIHLAKGHTKITEEASASVWWKPWTWGKTKTVVVWTDEEARNRTSKETQ